MLNKSQQNKVFVVCVQDFAYHGLAAFFYLSAGVILAYITILQKYGVAKTYRIDIAAVVRTDFSIKQLFVCVVFTGKLLTFSFPCSRVMIGVETPFSITLWRKGWLLEAPA